MRIGIDIDDTIANTNDLLIEEAIKYDKTINGKGIRDIKAFDFTKMFYWSLYDKENFLSYAIEKVIKEVVRKDDALEYINKLKDEGNYICFITYRQPTYISDPFEITKKWLDDNGFKYDELIVNSGSKGIICRNNNIDLFIDDSVLHVNDALANKVDALLYDTVYNQGYTIRRVYCWKEIYNIIKEEYDGRGKSNNK